MGPNCQVSAFGWYRDGFHFTVILLDQSQLWYRENPLQDFHSQLPFIIIQKDNIKKLS